ncbi:MAG TPA: hypothetical protein VKE41_04105 [Roseiflexaceae bacterium]|nr:hypothetical protein [Roseiflexaceae bacterium]
MRRHYSSDLAGHIVKIERFDDNALASSLQRRPNSCADIVGGHGQDGHFLERWVGAKSDGDFPAIDARHTEVKQNQNRLALASEPNRLIAVSCFDDGEAEVGE